MAARVLMMKLIQELHGLAEFTNRRPQPQSPLLAMIQLRARMSQGKLPPRRHSLPIQVTELADLPHPVKITHLGTSPAPASRV